MTSLAEKEGLKGKVQMIYLDPPYGIKFGSNWQVSTRKREVKDGKVEDATRQPEQVKAFRDTWQLGIHSYLAYLRDRLVVARELLTESGSIFVQIGDENVHLVRNILDEVFGSGNFICMISVQKAPYATSNTLAPVLDYLLWYAKDATKVKYRTLYKDKTDISSIDLYRLALSDDGQNFRTLNKDEMDGGIIQDNWRRYRLVSLISQGAASENQPFIFEGVTYLPPLSSHWKIKVGNLGRVAFASRIQKTPNSIQYRGFIDDFPVSILNNIWTDTITGSFMEDKIYVVQTNPKIIERCMLMTTDPGDLVLDPTCGSGTTAYVAEQWGRRWITIDTSRVAIALARTRLMSVRFPYYLLADSYEGRKKERELNPLPTVGEAPEENAITGTGEGDLRHGFVYKRVPHVTLKSIANNEEIDVIHAKYQTNLEELRTKINKAAVKKWEEWEIPQEASNDNQKLEMVHLLGDYWDLRKDRQREIDASIARNADTEFLYDQPYKEPRRIRVAGPFTIESLSPHRVLVPDDPATSFREDALNTQDFVGMIIENLRASGVQNTIKKERLKFDRLEPYAGTWIHAVGEYTEKDGKSRRVAVSIGPELGTVSPEQVKEAAKETVAGIGFDLLIVCGFAFDPHVSEEAKRYGKLTVLPAHMNPDLAMGDELLKKTGTGNLFMVFGEPDLEIKKKDGRITVHLKGLDVYDPTTGEVRSNSTDDIACWFIDTDYNEETFIVRHAYFTGADQPYEKLQRALRTEIDESAWSALYSTTSYPFEKPKSGKIAVKVINHYGDEVLKVYSVS